MNQHPWAGKRPDILICIADDWGFPHGGAHGCSWVNTPNSKCAPSRAALPTGRYSWQLEDACGHWCYFPEKFDVYPEILGHNGYHTGYTGKGWGPGNPGYYPDGRVRELTGPAVHERELDPPESKMSRKDYAGNFELFLERKPTDQPFCFWYGGHEPHRPYEWRAGIEKGGKDPSEIPAEDIPPFFPDCETVRTDMLDYAFEVEWFDKHLGRILRILEEKGEIENTVVIVTSDNRPPFPRLKGQQYERAYHEPLAVMWPGTIPTGGPPATRSSTTANATTTRRRRASSRNGRRAMTSVGGSASANDRNTSSTTYRPTPTA